MNTQFHATIGIRHQPAVSMSSRCPSFILPHKYSEHQFQRGEGRKSFNSSLAINITPLLPYSYSYSPLCLAGGPISAAETRLVWNMLQCCSAAELQCAVLAGRGSAAN